LKQQGPPLVTGHTPFGWILQYTVVSRSIAHAAAIWMIDKILAAVVTNFRISSWMKVGLRLGSL
jgi:hypothetical protein